MKEFNFNRLCHKEQNRNSLININSEDCFLPSLKPFLKRTILGADENCRNSRQWQRAASRSSVTVLFFVVLVFLGCRGQNPDIFHPTLLCGDPRRQSTGDTRIEVAFLSPQLFKHADAICWHVVNSKTASFPLLQSSELLSVRKLSVGRLEARFALLVLRWAVKNVVVSWTIRLLRRWIHNFLFSGFQVVLTCGSGHR